MQINKIKEEVKEIVLKITNKKKEEYGGKNSIEIESEDE